MDENKINPVEEMEQKQPILEDVFSDLPGTNSPQMTHESPIEKPIPQYQAPDPIPQQTNEPKITTYEPVVQESNMSPEVKVPTNFLFILILALILIVGAFVIWVIL